MFSSEDYGSPVFWISHDRPAPRSPRRMLNPSGAFNDPFYPQIRVKNREERTGAVEWMSRQFNNHFQGNEHALGRTD
jgi:hypothetical protein